LKAFLVAASIVSSNGAPTENLAGRRVIPLVPIRAVPSLELKTIDHPQYQFGYTISDTETGDAKTRQETRDGDLVYIYYFQKQKHYNKLLQVLLNSGDWLLLCAAVRWKAPHRHILC